MAAVMGEGEPRPRRGLGTVIRAEGQDTDGVGVGEWNYVSSRTPGAQGWFRFHKHDDETSGAA